MLTSKLVLFTEGFMLEGFLHHQYTFMSNLQEQSLSIQHGTALFKP